jgi:hypothetical protein
MGAESRTENGKKGVVAAASQSGAFRQDVTERRIQLYGWDSRTEIWSGPTELSFPRRAPQRLLEALRTTPGRSWYGPVNCCASGEPAARFFTIVHDLCDCAVAMIYCHESRTGPAEILVVVPPEVRTYLRPEFAFGYVAFVRFLGALGEDSALTVHDLITAAITAAHPCDSLVFSISTGLWMSDLDHVLSICVEKIAMSMLQWIAERNAAPSPAVSRSHSKLGGPAPGIS